MPLAINYSAQTIDGTPIEKYDYVSLAYADGFELDDLTWVKEHKEMHPAIFFAGAHNQIEQGASVKRIKEQNQFPAFCDEDRQGNVVRGKYTFDNLVERYQSFTPIELVEAAQYIYTDNYSTVERAKAEALILARAAEIRQGTALKTVFKEVKAAYNAGHEEISDYPIRSELLQLKRDGSVKPTIENFRTIMENDPFYNGGEPEYKKVFFNVISNRAEIHTFTPAGELQDIRNWEEADFSASMEHIESKYNLYDKAKHDAALFSFWKGKEYNPITLQLDSLRGSWDGVERCSEFLTVWGKADHDEYTRAVSRMIFDGAVARAYSPGIKFDVVPVLTGKQGNGKSAICTFLAINDKYHCTMASFDKNEQKNYEKLEGKWIIELEELVTRKDVDFQGRLKAFTTSIIDTYRKPYSRGVSDLPKKCIFIGTTNYEDFLADLTGNRRFFPVAIRSNGRLLYWKEQEVRSYIIQCYAEAVYHYDHHESMLVIPEKLIEEAEARQAEAMQPSFIFDGVMDYINGLKVGDQFFIRHIWEYKLQLSPRDVLDKHLEQQISAILRNCPSVDKVGRERVKGTDRKVTMYEKINPNLPPIE